MLKIDQVKSFLPVIFLSIFFITTSCGSGSNPQIMTSEGTSDGIMSGAEVAEKSALSQFIVQVRVYEPGSTRRYSLCTGVIVSNDAILTAAHCFPAKPGRTVAIFGTSDNNLIKEVPVTHYRVHPNYPATYPKNQDLALMRMKTLIPTGFKPINLFSGDVATATKLTILGYGAQSTHPSEEEMNTPKKLRMVNLQVRYFDKKAAFVYLAMNAVYGPAPGDSGGPLIIKMANGDFNLVGIASGFTPEYNPDTAKYTLVEPHKVWIKNTILEMRATAKAGEK